MWIATNVLIVAPEVRRSEEADNRLWTSVRTLGHSGSIPVWCIKRPTPSPIDPAVGKVYLMCSVHVYADNVDSQIVRPGRAKVKEFNQGLDLHEIVEVGLVTGSRKTRTAEHVYKRARMEGGDENVWRTLKWPWLVPAEKMCMLEPQVGRGVRWKCVAWSVVYSPQKQARRDMRWDMFDIDQKAQHLNGLSAEASVESS
ncbi:hypothetical protein C0Q70_14013 [Pomacea canaliculata]|uniref:Uncharacterized protein n=1 Tax=Pomacea canaliculata TaxID=400727 RepID=A0A2T7NYU9_POMCA|nr:hypothetical protein C0Q70_14013 [Pomacea canaliculata]